MTDTHGENETAGGALVKAAAAWALEAAQTFRADKPGEYEALRRALESGDSRLEVVVALNGLAHDLSLMATGALRPICVASQTVHVRTPGAPN
jgi:hypothetical protein